VPVRLIPAAVCALGAHALLYGTFRPGDGLHGYFGWYEPALAVASLAALLLVRPAWLRTSCPLGDTARRFSTTALVVLFAQESVERTLQAGHPAFAMLTPSQLLVLMAGIGATALLLALVLRAGQVAVRMLRRARTPRILTVSRWNVVTVCRGRPRPLAERFALRAPPFAAVS
jgi:hypothetical protein